MIDSSLLINYLPYRRSGQLMGCFARVDQQKVTESEYAGQVVWISCH